MPDSVSVPERATLQVNIRWDGDVQVFKNVGGINEPAVLEAMIRWLDAHPGWKPALNDHNAPVDYLTALPVIIRRRR